MGRFSSIFGAKALKKANANAAAAGRKATGLAMDEYKPFAEGTLKGYGAYNDAIGLGDSNRAIAAFENSPFYRLTHQAALDAGQQGVANMSNAAGTRNSGSTLVALADRARYDTNKSFQSYVNPLAGSADAGLGIAGNRANLQLGLGTINSDYFRNKGEIKAGQMAGFDSIFSDLAKNASKAAQMGM